MPQLISIPKCKLVNLKKDCEVRVIFKWEMTERIRWNEHDGEREGGRMIARK